MGLDSDALIDEVQALTGRTGDTALITDARVNRWLNEAQVKIAEEIPGLLDLEFDCTTWTCITDGIKYDLAELTMVSDTTTVNDCCHIHDIYYIDGAESIKLDFQPQDEFDDELIDPTHTDFSPNKPTRWTRQGNQVKIRPLIDDDYSGDTLRVHGTKYAADITGASTSDINHADKGLIYYSVAEAWGAMGNEEKFAIWGLKFNGWLADFKTKNDRMLEWDGQISFDEYEAD